MPTIKPDQLQAGDILLCSTNDALSKLIQEVDQGGYSHTILYVGKENGKHMIVHATTKGILHQELSKVLNLEEVDLMDAYRFHGENGEELGSPNFPVEPIIKNALSFVGGPYFYSELILGGLVILSVDQFKNKTLQKAVRLLGGLIESKLVKLFEKHKGKKAMVCVQVATTSFWNASNDTARPYGIRVKIDGTRKHVPLLDNDSQLNDLKQKVLNLYPVFDNLTLNKPIADGELILKAGQTLLPLGTCTLRDLSRSPSLTLIGNLKNTKS